MIQELITTLIIPSLLGIVTDITKHCFMIMALRRTTGTSHMTLCKSHFTPLLHYAAPSLLRRRTIATSQSQLSLRSNCRVSTPSPCENGNDGSDRGCQGVTKTKCDSNELRDAFNNLTETINTDRSNKIV